MFDTKLHIHKHTTPEKLKVSMPIHDNVNPREVVESHKDTTLYQLSRHGIDPDLFLWLDTEKWNKG